MDSLARVTMRRIPMRGFPWHIFAPPLQGNAGQTYAQKVLDIQTANLIGYWPLWEAAGVTAADQSAQANNGSYTGVDLAQPGIGDGNTCPYFGGSGDYVNVYSAGLASDFNSQELTVALWVKVNAASFWTDAAYHYIIRLGADVANVISFDKQNTNNSLQLAYTAGGTTDQYYGTGHSDTGWIHLALTVSKAADQLKAYKNGSQIGATQTTLGAWVGSLASTLSVIGAQNTTPAAVHNGYIAHVALWTMALDAAQIASLATV